MQENNTKPPEQPLDKTLQTILRVAGIFVGLVLGFLTFKLSRPYNTNENLGQFLLATALGVLVFLILQNLFFKLGVWWFGGSHIQKWRSLSDIRSYLVGAAFGNLALAGFLFFLLRISSNQDDWFISLKFVLAFIIYSILNFILYLYTAHQIRQLENKSGISITGIQRSVKIMRFLAWGSIALVVVFTRGNIFLPGGRLIVYSLYTLSDLEKIKDLLKT